MQWQHLPYFIDALQGIGQSVESVMQAIQTRQKKQSIENYMDQLGFTDEEKERFNLLGQLPDRFTEEGMAEAREQEYIEGLPKEIQTAVPLYGGLAKVPEHLKAKHFPFLASKEEAPTAKEMLGEEKAKTELGRKMGVEKVLPGIVGGYGKERFVKEVGKPQLGMSVLEDLGIVPKRKTVKKAQTYKPSEKEKLSQYLVLAGQGMLTNPQHRKIVEIAGYDPDTGEKVEKKGGVGSVDEMFEALMGGGGEAETPTAGRVKPPEKFYKFVESEGVDKIDWDAVKAKHPDWDLSDFGL